VVVVEGEKAVVSPTEVKPKRGSEDMESPGSINTVEETERNPSEGSKVTKTIGVKLVLTVAIEEMTEMLTDLVHGEDPTRTSIMQHRVKDKVTYQLLQRHPSNQLIQGTMVGITGAAQEPTNIGIMVTMATCTMMGTSRNNITITNPGMLTIALTMTTTPDNLINVRLTKEARGKVRIKQLARSRRRLKSKLNLKSKLYKFLVDNPKYTKYLMN
jgi:hypothetical protein